MTLTSSRSLPIWFGFFPRTPSKTSLHSGTRFRVGDPGPVEPVLRLARLVLPDLGHGLGVDLRVTPAGNERGHAAHRVGPAAVAGLDQQFGVGAHERSGHRDRVALGQDELAAPGAELLDHAEQVVPAARVQPGRMVPQLVEDLLHLECRRDRLDQHRGPDRTPVDAERVLRQVERVVPQPRLEVALVLGQVEVGSLALVQLPLRAGRHVKAEVDQAARGARAVNENVLFVQVPAARADHDRGQFAVRLQRVFLAFCAGVVNGPVQRVLEVQLAGDHVVPQRGIGVLEVRQPHIGPRIEGIDRHFLVGRAGDLDPAVDQARRERRHPPVRALANVRRLGEEVEHRSAGKLGLTAAARGQQLGPARSQFGVKGRDKVDGLRCKDLVVAITVRTRDLHAFGSRHV